MVVRRNKQTAERGRMVGLANLEIYKKLIIKK